MFKDIYDMKLLSANQIARAYYKNSNYGYRRIRELFKEGYLYSKPLVIGRKKVTQYYFLTEKAIREAEIENPRKAHKNFIKSKYMVERQIAINEIYISLIQAHKQYNQPNIWQWEDSRASKANYEYNRGSLIAGVLTNTKTNMKYNIYLPNKRKDMHELSEKIHKEVDKNSVIRNNIVLCTNREIFQHYINNMKFAGRNMMVLPHAEGINFIYNALCDYDAWLENVIRDILPPPAPTPRPREKHRPPITDSLTREYLPHADYSTNDYFIAEMLSTDLVKLHFIDQYSTDYKSDKPLKIICWDTQLKSFLKNRIKNTNNMISYYPLQWSNSYMLNSIDKSYVYEPKITEKLNAKEKTRTISVALSPKIFEYLKKKYPKGTRSQYIQNLILNSKEYKIYEGD